MLLSFARFVSQHTEPGPDQPDELYFKVSQLFDFFFFFFLLAGLTGLFLVSAQLGARSVPTLVLFFFRFLLKKLSTLWSFLGAAEVVLHLILMHYSFAILRHPRHDTNMCD